MPANDEPGQGQKHPPTSTVTSTVNTLTHHQNALVTKLVSTQFFGYAHARLSKLPTPVLDELVRRICSASNDASVSTHDEKVTKVLNAKKELQKQARKEKEQPSGDDRCLVPTPPTPPTPPTLLDKSVVQPTKPNRPVFRASHELNIVAFNALKLRLDREELQDEWDAIVLEFSKYDVLMLSEVRASDKLFKARALRLVEMLDNCNKGEQWTMMHSEPSGPGAKEVHLVLAKRPVEIMKVRTLAEMDGQRMDHAPIVATLRDTRFLGELKLLNVCSVHMPPKSSKDRRASRDAQIRKLTSLYPTMYEYRIGQPFSNQAAKEACVPYTAHIIGGDFNADANELRDLNVEKCGWEIVLGNVRTSGGGKSYDNWLINRDCKDHLVIGADVLELAQYANFSRGQQGVSDHAPIALRIKEIPRILPPSISDSTPRRRKPSVKQTPLISQSES